MGEVASYGSPVLVRVEVNRSEPLKNSEATTHSYCIFVAEEKNELGVSVYQAYFGQYDLAEWFDDIKFKVQPVNFELYVEQLVNLISDDKELRKKTYGELYRLTGSELDVPNKEQLHIYYKMQPVNLELAMSNIMQERMYANRTVEQINRESKNEQLITPIEFLKNICWKNAEDCFPDAKLSVGLIRKEVERQQDEIQMNLNKFRNVTMSAPAVRDSSAVFKPNQNILPSDNKNNSNTISNSSPSVRRDDSWQRFYERHPELLSGQTPAATSSSVSSSSQAIENDDEDEKNKNSPKSGGLR